MRSKKKIDEANAKARDKYAEAEIDNYGAMAGAAKKMFGEKPWHIKPLLL